MNKELLNIVVTGGPCGGKTTALDELPKFISNYMDITNNSDYDDDSICTDYNIDSIFKRRSK